MLNPKQNAFCLEYLADFNGAAAAARAGYSKKTANRIADENLSKPDIQAEIRRLIDERSARLEITADEVLKELWNLASSNIYPVLKAVQDGTENELSDDVKRTLKHVKVKRDKDGKLLEYHIALHDKIRPIEMVARHLGMFRDDAEAIATLTQYGTVTRTEKGFTFEYAEGQSATT